jgi:hypothetical protein
MRNRLRNGFREGDQRPQMPAIWLDRPSMHRQICVARFATTSVCSRITATSPTVPQAYEGARSSVKIISSPHIPSGAEK